MSFKPNYFMLRLRVLEAQDVKSRYPEAEVMPDGYICPGYDVSMVKPCGVFKYLLNSPTKWSCQGVHEGSKKNPLAYLWFVEEVSPPEDLVARLKEQGFDFGWGDSPTLPGKKRFLIRAFNPNDPDLNLTFDQMVQRSNLFMKFLSDYSDEVIRDHLPNMTGREFEDLHALMAVAA